MQATMPSDNLKPSLTYFYFCYILLITPLKVVLS